MLIGVFLGGSIQWRSRSTVFASQRTIALMFESDLPVHFLTPARSASLNSNMRVFSLG
jgi:hypothetical protein